VIKEANPSNFKELISDCDIIYFYSQSCTPCKMLKPNLLELAEEGKKIVAVNNDEYAEIGKEYHIMSNPTLLYMKDGNDVKRSGYKPTGAIKEILESL